MHSSPYFRSYSRILKVDQLERVEGRIYWQKNRVARPSLTIFGTDIQDFGNSDPDTA